MQKIINDPAHVVEDMLEGYLKAHDDIVKQSTNPRVIKYSKAPVKDKVGIVTGGGSGHEPAFIGYLGKNMVDAVAVGEIFSSPSAKMFLDAFKEADSGKGVACLFGNYSGDKMNVKMAVRMAKREGITVKSVIANDDVPSAPNNDLDKRRGVAGEILMWKVGGAKAALGGTLDEVIAISQKAIDNTRSMGIGLSPCTIPAVGHPNFTIDEGSMEIGIGHHGEPGTEVTPLMSASELASKAMNIILPDMPFQSGDDTVLLISGLGSTPMLEQYILFNEITKILYKKKIHVYKTYIGNYFTSLEMAGITVTMMKLDDELKKCIDLETDSPGLHQFGR